jgi:hypothetical protein
MSTWTKSVFRVKPFDATSLAWIFEQITGRQASEAEIAAVQKQLDQARRDSATLRTGDQSEPSTDRYRRGHHAGGIKKRPH